MSDLSLVAVDFAISQIGMKENPVGSNWGKPVEDYLLSVGIDFPAPWCMAFVYWCFEQASKKLAVPNPLVRTGQVMHAWVEAKDHRVSTPNVGDIFIMSFGKGIGHTGIVYQLGQPLTTIEGNTNDNGGREGFEVDVKHRLTMNPKLIGYLRY